MGRAWPDTAGELADQLVADVVTTLEDLEASTAPGLELPATFGGHPVGPDVAADLAFTLGLLHADGVERVAGRDVAEAVLDVLRVIDGPGTHSFYSYRAAETIGRLGGVDANPRLGDWSDAEQANLAAAVDSSGFEQAFDDGHLPNNYAIVLARAEHGRRLLGLLDDERFLDKLMDRSRSLLSTAASGWIDDAPDDRGQFDIYTPDMFLFSEPLADELGDTWRDGFRRVLADAADLALAGGSIVWGRSIGALGLAMSVELGSVAVGRDLTADPAGWLARAAHGAGVLHGWFRRGVLDSHVERATMFYRGPERRLQMTLDITGKLLQAVAELRARPDAVVGPVKSAFADVDRFVAFDPDRPRGVWVHRRRHLQFVVPAVGGYMNGYASVPRAPGLWEPPTDGPVALGPVVHHGDKQRYYQVAPTRVEHEPMRCQIELGTLGEHGQLEAPEDAPSGSRTTVYTVEGRSLVVDDTLRIDRRVDEVRAVGWALPQRAERPYTVDAEGLDDTSVTPVRSADIAGIAQWRSFWGAPTLVHEFDAPPAPELRVRWTMTPLLRVGSTAGTQHGYPGSLFAPVQDRIQLVDAPIDDVWAAYELDVLHLHWPEWYAGIDPDRTAAVIAQFVAAGTPILWTMHNLVPHMFREPGARESYQLWAEAADAVIHHTEWGRDRALATYTYGDHTRHEVVPHGHWVDRFGPLAPRAEAEQAVGLEPAPIRLGVVGAPRIDKHVQLVIDAMHSSRRDDIQLVLFSLTDEEVPDD
ncbi:MAG: hypothetical protein OES57_16440, partial [Acidimicrobiia bacterium]|nr:hypothetical protein [Acidimicrobiia bacterium]